MFIDNSIDNIKLEFNLFERAFHPNFFFEVSFLTKIYLSTNEYVQQLIEDNENLKVYNEIIGDEVSKVFKHNLIYLENEKKEQKSFGSKNLMELLEEDIYIYKLFLKGGDYQKAFEEKKENERKEMEEEENSEESHTFKEFKYWEPQIRPNDDLMSAILNALD